jgi:hypothetical protein
MKSAIAVLVVILSFTVVHGDEIDHRRREQEQQERERQAALRLDDEAKPFLRAAQRLLKDAGSKANNEKGKRLLEECVEKYPDTFTGKEAARILKDLGVEVIPKIPKGWRILDGEGRLSSTRCVVGENVTKSHAPNAIGTWSIMPDGTVKIVWDDGFTELIKGNEGKSFGPGVPLDGKPTAVYRVEKVK